MNLDPFLLWLLSASLRASLLALAVTCLQFVLRPWLPARWRYALWLPVALVLIAPALPTSRLSVQNYFASDAMIAQNTPQTATAPIVPAEIPLVTTAHASWKPNGQQILFAIWLLGAGGVTVVGLIGYSRSLQRIQRRAIEADVALKRSITSLAQRIKLRRVPRVIVSNAVESPAVAGFLRPMLLLPANFPAGFTETESHLVLLHELMHLKRHDLPVNWLLCLLQVLHWFNPLLWLTFSRMRADREAACDAQVLACDSEDRRAEYGNALLKLQSIPTHSGLSLAFVGIFERSAGIRSRIQTIATHRRAHPGWIVAVTMIIFALIVMGATETESKEAAKKKEILIESHFLELPENYDLNLMGKKELAGGGGIVFIQSPKDFATLMKTFSQVKGIELLGAPSIITCDGQRAQIEVTGQETTIQKTEREESKQKIDLTLDVLPKFVFTGIYLDIIAGFNKRVTTGTEDAKDGSSSDGTEIKEAFRKTIKDEQTIILLPFRPNIPKPLLIAITVKVKKANTAALDKEKGNNTGNSENNVEAKASPSKSMDPSAQFLRAYQKLQDGERFHKNGNFTEAITNYHLAEDILTQLNKNNPEWKAALIKYRLLKIREEIKIAMSGANLPPSDTRNPTQRGADLNMEILDARLRDETPASKRLRITIKSRSNVKVDNHQTKVVVIFYEKNATGEIQESKSNANSQWITPPINWADNEPELLDVQYAPHNAPPPEFAGYIVGVYYKGTLQDSKAAPDNLAKTFPLPPSIEN